MLQLKVISNFAIRSWNP